MASVSSYLNFQETTEEAFNFYKSIFGGEFTGDIMRIGDAPAPEDSPPLAEKDKTLVMHVELKTLGGLHSLMGTDCIDSMGIQAKAGNNMHINLDPGTRVETKRLFDGLSEGGEK